MKSSYISSPLFLFLLLTGCASSALKDAPEYSNKPWIPHTNHQGMITPHQDGNHNDLTTPMLKMPPGYVLPHDKTLPERKADVDISPEHSYSLAEIIDIAQSTNPQTRISWDQARDAALATGITRAAYLPQLTASVIGGYGRSKAGYNSNTGTTHLNGDGELQVLTMNWLLFDFGKRYETVHAAQERSLASNISFTQAHQKVIYNVTSSYYLYMASYAHLQLIKQSLTNARKIEAAAKARLKNKQGTVIDVAQAENATAQEELRLVQTQGEIENHYLSLMTAIGLPPTLHIALKPTQVAPLSLNDTRMSEKMVQEAVSHRPDILAAYAQERAAQHDVRAAKAEFLPKIFFNGNVGYSTGSLGLNGIPGVGGGSSTVNVASNNFSGLILGGISVPVFDGGIRSAQVKIAQDRADSANKKLHDKQDNSVREIVTAENSLHTAITSHMAAEKLLHAAQISFDSALEAYRSGTGSVTQMLQLQNTLFNATISYSDSYHAALIAAASLAFATGSLGETPLPNNLPQ